jgi:hypothetical protein
VAARFLAGRGTGLCFVTQKCRDESYLAKCCPNQGRPLLLECHQSLSNSFEQNSTEHSTKMHAPTFQPMVLSREVSGPGDLELCATSTVSWISQHFSTYRPAQQMDALSWIACRVPTNLRSAQQDDITDQIASLFVHMSPIQFHHIRYNFPPIVDTPLQLRHMSLLRDFLRYQLPGIQSEKVPDVVANFVRS